MLRLIRLIVIRALLVLFSVGLTLVLLEAFIRVGFDLLPAQIQGDIQNVRVVPWDDEVIVPPVPFEPDLGYQSRIAPGYENYPVRWMDARFTFDTINLWDHPVGLRTSPEPRWPIDMMAFGDSFTFCWTAVEDCWVQRLQSDYGWSTINAGQPGTGPTGQLKLIREVGVPIEPKLVIWQRYPNDSFDDYVLSWMRQETPGLSSAPAPAPARELKGLERYSALLTILDNVLNPPNNDSPYQYNQVVEVAGRQMLIATNEFTSGTNTSYPATEYGWKKNVTAYVTGVKLLKQEIGAEVVFVFIPTKEEAYAEYLTGILGEQYLDDLGQNHRQWQVLCQANHWHCVDMLPAFQEAIHNGETIYYARDFHLDASGNALVAQLVNDYVVEQGLLPAGQ